MPLSDERKGENESFFRELNERLESHALGKEPADAARSFEAVCECADEDCTVRLRVSFVEYEAVRDDPKRFIVATGHADAGFERVVTSPPGYDIVEKFGEAALVTERLDPRSDE